MPIGNPDPLAIKLAGIALAKAKLLDRRMQETTRETILSWAEVFEGLNLGEGVEVAQAVIDHYREPNAWPLMPGNVIDRVNAMPLSSSRHRIEAYLRKWADHPYSPAIERLTGIKPKLTYPTPEGVHGDVDAEREFHRQEVHKWLDFNADTLVYRVMNSNPKEIQQ